MSAQPANTIEVFCPSCGEPQTYKIPATDPAPFDDRCSECESAFTVDPDSESAHWIPSW